MYVYSVSRASYAFKNVVQCKCNTCKSLLLYTKTNRILDPDDAQQEVFMSRLVHRYPNFQ